MAENFTNVNLGDHEFIGNAIDVNGIKKSTEKRFITLSGSINVKNLESV